jgi:signal transduction histidine kinase
MMKFDTRIDLEAARTSELRRKSYSMIGLSFLSLMAIELALLRVDSHDFISRLAALFIVIVYLSRFFHVRYSRESPLRWQRTNMVLCGLSGVAWATLLCQGILLTGSYPSLRLALYLFGTGHVAVCTYSLAIQKSAFRALIFPEILGMFLAFYLTADTPIDQWVGFAIFSIWMLFGNFQRKIVEKSWIQNQRHALELQALIDSFPGGIIVVSNGEAHLANAYFRALFRETHQSGGPKEILDLLLKSQEFFERYNAFQNDSNQGRADFDATLCLTSGKRAYWFLLVKSSAGESIIVGIDVQAKKDADAEIEAQRKKLETSAKLAALGEMAGGVAHEINNPIFVILSRVQLLEISLQKSPEILERLKPHLEAILTTCDRVVRIVRGLKILSRDSESEKFEHISLRTTIEQTLELSAARLRQSGARLDLSLPPHDCLVEAMPVQLSQVILNLLNNACDAVEGTSSPWIRIEIEYTEKEVEIAVSDSGPGVPQGIRAKIMEPFFTTKPVGKGTGLGLSISLGIVKTHHGELIYDESAPHTRFVVRLPREQPTQ